MLGMSFLLITIESFILIYFVAFTGSVEIHPNDCKEFNISINGNNHLNGIYIVQRDHSNNNNIYLAKVEKHLNYDYDYDYDYDDDDMINISVKIIITNNKSISVNKFNCVTMKKNNEWNSNYNILSFGIDERMKKYISNPINHSNLLITYIICGLIILILLICICCFCANEDFNGCNCCNCNCCNINCINCNNFSFCRNLKNKNKNNNDNNNKNTDHIMTARQILNHETVKSASEVNVADILKIELPEKQRELKLSDLAARNSVSSDYNLRKQSTMTAISDGSSVFGVGGDINSSIPIQNTYHKELYTQFQQSSSLVPESLDEMHELKRGALDIDIGAKERSKFLANPNINIKNRATSSNSTASSQYNSEWSQLSLKSNNKTIPISMRDLILSNKNSESSTFTQDMASKDIAKYTDITLSQYHGSNAISTKRIPKKPLPMASANRAVPRKTHSNQFTMKPMPNKSLPFPAKLLSTSASTSVSASPSDFVAIQAIIGSVPHNNVEFVHVLSPNNDNV